MADGQLCLVCDQCGAEYRGRPSEGHPQRGYRVLMHDRLQADAIAIGWTGGMNYDSYDRCPACSAAPKSARNEHE
jgi:hypothetical protein